MHVCNVSKDSQGVVSRPIITPWWDSSPGGQEGYTCMHANDENYLGELAQLS